MTAQQQPAETGRSFVPQTVAEIRSALPGTLAARFDADIAAADAFGVSGVVDEWWARAVLAPELAQIDASFAAIRRGEVELIPAAEVIDA